MKVYISGKITGLPLSEAEERFKDAEELISALNLTPVNPLKNGLPRHSSWEEHMAKDIELLKQCEAIFMLDNWTDSRGAKIEYDFAIGAGKDVIFESLYYNGRKIERTAKAIHEVMGLTMKDITTKSATRETFYARMIFAYQNRDMHHKDIGKILNRSRVIAYRYISKYPDEYKYNRPFRDIAKRVELIMKKEPSMAD